MWQLRAIVLYFADETKRGGFLDPLEGAAFFIGIASLRAVRSVSPAKRRQTVSTHPLEKLLAMWKSGAITVEQLAGYLLQNVILLEKRLEVVEKGAKYLKPPSSPNDEEVKQ